jgi:hypothetical protein
MTLTIEVNLPPIECSPNHGMSGRHWGKTSGAKRAYRDEGRLCALQELRKHPWDVFALKGWYGHRPVVLSAVVVAHRSPVPDGRYRPADLGNLIASTKAVVDGFVDAGVVPNDTHQWVKWGEIEMLRTKAAVLKRFGALGRPRIIFTVEQR